MNELQVAGKGKQKLDVARVMKLVVNGRFNLTYFNLGRAIS
jgi:hypothetical protein